MSGQSLAFWQGLAVFLCSISLLASAPTDCDGSELVSGEVWNLAREMDKIVQIAHVPREIIRAAFDAWFAIWRAGAILQAVANCALGMAVLIAHSLPEVERRWGTDFAKEQYLVYNDIVQQYGHLRNEFGFSWKLETHQSASYPLLLGLWPQTCGKTNLRVYTYDTDFAKRTLGCSQGMFASEVFVHRFLLHSDCYTQDPEEADFFFVPVYAACVMTKEEKKADEMDTFYKELVNNSLPYFSRKEGRDHIFLWSSETYDFPSWLSYVHTSVFLSVEARPIECSDFDFFSEETAGHFGASCQHCYWCFQPWKDMVIPGFVEDWSVRKMHALERPATERSFTACYHGADSNLLAIYAYANTTVRNRLQDLRDLPHVSIGYRFPMITDYFDRIGDCHFCFAPKGLGFWSNRLYEVLFAGCIPVLLSDDIGLPFDDFVDWRTFSIKWPMAEVTPALVQHLEDLLTNRPSLVEALHEGVQRNRCWFDYNSKDPECSPYIGILRSLQRRKSAFPSYHGRFWNAGHKTFE